MTLDPLSNLGDGNGDSSNGHGSSSSGGHANGNGSGAQSTGTADGRSASLGALTTLENRLPSTNPPLNWSYGPPARPEILSAKPNPVELLHAVRRRWPLALGLGLGLATLVSGLLWYLVPVNYEAVSLLQVKARPPQILGNEGSAEEFAVFKRTQVGLLLSNQVMNNTLRERGVTQLSMVKENSEDPVSWLKDQMEVDYPNDAEVMRIAMSGKKKDEVVKLVKTVVDVYLREVVQHEKQVRVTHEARLKDNFTSLTDEYEREYKALMALQKIHNTAGSEAAQIKKRLALGELDGLMIDRRRIMDQIAANEWEVNSTRSRLEKPQENRPHEALVEMELSKDLVIQDLTKKISEMNHQIGEMRRLAKKPQGMGHLQNLQRSLQGLEDALEERKHKLQPQIVDYLIHAGNARTQDMIPLSLPLLESQKAYLDGKLTEANARVEEKSKEVSAMENFSAEVAGKEEQLAAKRDIKNQLGAKLDEINIEKMAPDRITLLDEATLTNGRGDAMKKYAMVAFAGLLSFSGVVLGIAFLEFQGRKVNSVKEVNDGLGIRVIGELPSIAGRKFRRVKGGKGSLVLKALMAERIDGTRTALIHCTSIEPPRVVMVTSAAPREGKTTTSTQLAASLARSGRRTLLIDADIRNPGAHRVFEIPADPGLCELLRGEANREAVIHPTRTANLWLMPAGRCDLRSVQALSSSFLGTTIAALSVQFDYVIIDSGPVLKVADPLLVGQHVDAVILSVLRDVSKVPNVYEAAERLRSVGITVLGSVVNGVNDDVARHGVELLIAETPVKSAEAAGV